MLTSFWIFQLDYLIFAQGLCFLVIAAEFFLNAQLQTLKNVGFRWGILALSYLSYAFVSFMQMHGFKIIFPFYVIQIVGAIFTLLALGSLVYFILDLRLSKKYPQKTKRILLFSAIAVVSLVILPPLISHRLNVYLIPALFFLGNLWFGYEAATTWQYKKIRSKTSHILTIFFVSYFVIDIFAKNVAFKDLVYGHTGIPIELYQATLLLGVIYLIEKNRRDIRRQVFNIAPDAYERYSAFAVIFILVGGWLYSIHIGQQTSTTEKLKLKNNLTIIQKSFSHEELDFLFVSDSKYNAKDIKNLEEQLREFEKIDETISLSVLIRKNGIPIMKIPPENKKFGNKPPGLPPHPARMGFPARHEPAGPGALFFPPTTPLAKFDIVDQPPSDKKPELQSFEVELDSRNGISLHLIGEISLFDLDGSIFKKKLAFIFGTALVIIQILIFHILWIIARERNTIKSLKIIEQDKHNKALLELGNTSEQDKSEDVFWNEACTLLFKAINVDYLVHWPMIEKKQCFEVETILSQKGINFRKDNLNVAIKGSPYYSTFISAPSELIQLSDSDTSPITGAQEVLHKTNCENGYFVSYGKDFKNKGMIALLSSTPDREWSKDELNFISSFIEKAEKYLLTSEKNRTEKQFHDLVENAPVAMIVLENSRILYCNTEALHIYKYPDSYEMIDQRLSNFMSAQEYESLNKNLETLGVNVNSFVSCTQNHLTKHGDEITVSLSAVNAQFYGRPVILLTIKDITEIEKLIKKMKEAQEEAVRANKAKSIFLANMTHELKTPMNGIIGMSDILIDTPLNSDQKEYTDTIRASARSLLDLINQILNFSKLEAGKLEIKRQHFDLNTTIEFVKKLLSPHANEKGIQTIINLDPHIPNVLFGDNTRIQQVLINIWGNAIKFTSQGSVKIEVFVLDQSYNKTELLFSITDSGIGIKSRDLEKLFNPFSQLDDRNEKNYSGTGLGLAISKQLVELMGGKIGVESKENQGSTFWFSIPFSEEEMEAKPSIDLTKHFDEKVLIDLFGDQNQENISTVIRESISEIEASLKHYNQSLEEGNIMKATEYLLSIKATAKACGFSYMIGLCKNEQAHGNHTDLQEKRLKDIYNVLTAEITFLKENILSQKELL